METELQSLPSEEIRIARNLEHSEQDGVDKLFLLSNRDFYELLRYAEKNDGDKKHSNALRAARAYEQLLVSRGIFEQAHLQANKENVVGIYEWLDILVKVATRNECHMSVTFFKEDFEMYEFLRETEEQRENEMQQDEKEAL